MKTLDYFQLIWVWHIKRKLGKDIKVFFQQTIPNISIPFHLFHAVKSMLIEAHKKNHPKDTFTF